MSSRSLMKRGRRGGSSGVFSRGREEEEEEEEGKKMYEEHLTLVFLKDFPKAVS